MGSTTSKLISKSRHRRRSARGINRLPNELLLEIASHLDTTRDLSALMQANKRLALLLDHLLSAILLSAFRTSRYHHSLFHTVRRNPDALVLRLLRLGVDLDSCFCNCGSGSYCGCRPALHLAIAHRNATMVDSLFRHGASIYATYGTSGRNAIHVAIDMAEERCGHMRINREPDLAMLRMLLSGGRLKTMNDPGSLDRFGNTWLHHAIRVCARSFVSLVQVFLVDGLSVDVVGERKQTALHHAVLNNRADLTALLLRHGAEHRTMDSEGITPFGRSCLRPNCAVVEVFLRHDAALVDEVVNERGETVQMRVQREIERDMGSEDHHSEVVQRNLRTKRGLLKLIEALKAGRNPGVTGAGL